MLKEKKKKKKRLIIIIIIIIIILLLLAVGVAVPLCLKKKQKIDKPNIIIQDWNEDEDSTWSVVPDFIFDKKPLEREFGICNVMIRYKENDNEWSEWNSYTNNLVKNLSGTIEFEFKYVCGKKESPTTNIKLTVDKTLPELISKYGNTVGSKWEFCMDADNAKHIRSFNIYQGKEEIKIYPNKEENKEFLYSGNKNDNCFNVVLLKEGDYSAIATNDNDARIINRFKVLPFDNSMINESIFNTPENTVALKKVFFDGLGIFTSVNIGKLVEHTDIGTFNIAGLKEITVDEGNGIYTAQDGVLFYKGFETLIACPSGKNDGSYKIPDSTKIIESMAFAGTSLPFITLPTKLSTIGKGAFEECNQKLRLLVDGVEREVNLKFQGEDFEQSTDYVESKYIQNNSFSMSVGMTLNQDVLQDLKLKVCKGETKRKQSSI